MAIAIASLVLSGCGKSAQQHELDDLKQQVSDLQAQVADQADQDDDALGNHHENYEGLNSSPPAVPETVPVVPTVRSEPSDFFQRQEMERDLRRLERQADLDRMNHDIEMRKLHEEQQRRDRNRQLGIDF